MSFYGKNSPYFNTPFSPSGHLDIYRFRKVLAEDDDYLYEIQSQYTYRPDLLSFDLYNNAKLWWVFTVRNMDVLKDPVFDFVAGTKIFLPKASRIQAYMGN